MGLDRRYVLSPCLSAVGSGQVAIADGGGADRCLIQLRRERSGHFPLVALCDGWVVAQFAVGGVPGLDPWSVCAVGRVYAVTGRTTGLTGTLGTVCCGLQLSPSSGSFTSRLFLRQ